MHKPSPGEVDLLVGLRTCGNRASSIALRASATHIRGRSSASRSKPKLLPLPASVSRSGYSRVLYGHIRIAVEDVDDGLRFAAQVALVAEVTCVSWMNREVAGE